MRLITRQKKPLVLILKFILIFLTKKSIMLE